MLDKLFGSKARVKILKLFLLNPGKKYYIRQLSRDLKLQLNSVRRELSNLEQFGLLISATSCEEDKSGDEGEELKKLISGKLVEKKPVKKSASSKQEKKYFQANTDFTLFEEIRALFIKAQVLYEKDFIIKLQKIGKPKLLILTGFFVGNENSKADILVVGQINKDKFARLIKDLEKELGRELNYTLMSTSEFKVRRDMTDVFLYQILESNKTVVIDEIGL